MHALHLVAPFAGPYASRGRGVSDELWTEAESSKRSNKLHFREVRTFVYVLKDKYGVFLAPLKCFSGDLMWHRSA